MVSMEELAGDDDWWDEGAYRELDEQGIELPLNVQVELMMRDGRRNGTPTDELSAIANSMIRVEARSVVESLGDDHPLVSRELLLAQAKQRQEAIARTCDDVVALEGMDIEELTDEVVADMRESLGQGRELGSAFAQLGPASAEGTSRGPGVDFSREASEAPQAQTQREQEAEVEPQREDEDVQRATRVTSFEGEEKSLPKQRLYTPSWLDGSSATSTKIDDEEFGL